MMSMTKTEIDKKIDAALMCQKNRGSHSYIPVSWTKSSGGEHVTVLLCTTCLVRINTEELYKQFPIVDLNIPSRL